MNDDWIFIYMPRGSGKSRLVALEELDLLYRTGRITLDDYLNFTGEVLIRLFNQSEEVVENWKEMVHKQNDTISDRGDDMADREKVIKSLQICSVQNDVGCQCCPYFEERKTYGHEWCTTSMAQDALALLKKQEEIINRYQWEDGEPK